MAISPYFSVKEIACPCCGKYDDSLQFRQFLFLMDQLRRYYSNPIIVNSWYRCPKHNQEIGGHPKSAHLLGIAADIRTADHVERGRLIECWAAVVREKRVQQILHGDGDRLPFHIELGQGYMHIDVYEESVLGKDWVTLKKEK